VDLPISYLVEKGRKAFSNVGRETGLEPATTGITIRGCVTFTLPNKLERVTLPTVHFIYNPYH